jgi:putative tributyrin esterase
MRREITKHVGLVVMFCVCSLAQAPSPQPIRRLRDGEFFSQSLQRSVKYRVLVPLSYDTGDHRFPVLYLLHGLYGSYEDWTQKTQLELYSAGTEYIIAMPDAGDSWYTNWYKDPQNKFGDYVVQDFLPEIEQHYRVASGRANRVIAGLSMGGYGALKIGLLHPEMFRIAASFSGALNPTTDMATRHPDFAVQLNKVYGPSDSSTRIENELFKIAESANSQTLPYFYLDCGTADSFVATDRDFTSLLRSRKFAYEYHELPGNHNWGYWNARIRYFLNEVLSLREASKA